MVSVVHYHIPSTYYILSRVELKTAQLRQSKVRTTTYSYIYSTKLDLKIRLIQNTFMKSSIFQNMNRKFWRISALFTSGQESFIFGKLMISYIHSDIIWPLQVNLCQKLFFLQNMGRTCFIQKLFLKFRTCSPQAWAWNFHVLNL